MFNEESNFSRLQKGNSGKQLRNVLLFNTLRSALDSNYGQKDEILKPVHQATVDSGVKRRKTSTTTSQERPSSKRKLEANDGDEQKPKVFIPDLQYVDNDMEELAIKLSRLSLEERKKAETF